MVETMTHVDCPRCGRQFARDHMTNHLEQRHKRRVRDVSGDCSTCNDIGAGMMPPHDASARCESGWYEHCTCDTCF